MKNIRKRALLAVVALALLIGIAVYMTYAWYTRMTGVSATQFHVARWDFNANYQIDSFVVNVYEYSSVYGHNIAAPGTAGTLDLLLGAGTSDTAVTCSIQVDKSGMSEEFQDRIYFYYRDSSGIMQELIMDETSVTCIIEPQSSSIVTMYWKWLYDYDEYLEMNDKVQYYTCSRTLRPVRDSRLGAVISLDDLYMLNLYMQSMQEGNPAVSLQSIWEHGQEYAEEIAVANILEGKLHITSGTVPDLETLYAEYAGLTAADKAILEQYCETHSTDAIPAGSSSVLLTAGMDRLAADTYPEGWKIGYSYMSRLLKGARNLLLNYGTEVFAAFNDEELLADIQDDEPEEGAVTESLDALLNEYIFRGIVDWDDEKLTDFAAYFAEGSTVTLGLDAYYDTYLRAYEEFDEFDTRVGANPDVLKHDMNAFIYLVGTEVEPQAIDPAAAGWAD